MINEDASTSEIEDINEPSIDDVLAEKWAEIESKNNEDSNEDETIESIEDESVQIPEVTPPNSWKPALKEKFKTLEPDVQAEILRREDDIFKGIEKYKASAEWSKQFEPIADTLQGIRQYYGSEAEGIKTLFNAGQFAERDPIGFIKAFAESKGISLDGTAVQAQDNPMLNQLRQQVEQLSGYVGSQQQQEQIRINREAEKAIQSFTKNPDAVHFEELREDMASLLQAGLADTLEDAYDQALWRRKDLRESEISKQMQLRQSQAKEKAIGAKNAASVNVKQRGHLPSKEAELPIDDFMLKEAQRLGLV